MDENKPDISVRCSNHIKVIEKLHSRIDDVSKQISELGDLIDQHLIVCERIKFQIEANQKEIMHIKSIVYGAIGLTMTTVIAALLYTVIRQVQN